MIIPIKSKIRNVWFLIFLSEFKTDVKDLSKKEIIEIAKVLKYEMETRK